MSVAGSRTEDGLQTMLEVDSKLTNDSETAVVAVLSENEEKKSEENEEEEKKDPSEDIRSDNAPTHHFVSPMTVSRNVIRTPDQIESEIRDKIRFELECQDFFYENHIEEPDESIEFSERFMISVLGKARSGRECLIFQWIRKRWDPNGEIPMRKKYETVSVFGRNRSPMVNRANRTHNSTNEDFNQSRINDRNIKLYIICVDMTKQDCNEEMNEMLKSLIEHRNDYPKLSVVIAGTKCDDFILNATNSLRDVVSGIDKVKKDSIKQNIQKLENLVKHFRSKHDLSVLFIPTSAKYNWNVSVVFAACVAQWMSVHEFEYMEARRVQKEANQDAALDCCMNPLVLAAYDILTIIVSLLDIATDIIVLIDWYLLGRMTPFYISLTILCLAQISYIVAFLIRFCDNSNFTIKCRPLRSYQHSIWPVLLVIIPISPFLSFVMYFASLKGSKLGKWMDEMGFEIDDPSPRKHASKIESFLTEKLHKHMGFLLEAGVEAFPQSILQMAVMVSYSETNWVSVVSILLSLISVCTKSLVFSYALELRTMLFNYLSLCLDFISIFALISWIFYNPNGNGITTLGQMFIYRTVFFTTPFAAAIGFGFATLIIFEDWSYQLNYESHPYRILFKRMCILYTLWIIGTPFLILGTEVVCCSGLAFLMYQLFSERFHSGYGAGSIFWGQVFSFVNDGQSWSDKRLRCVMVVETVLSTGQIHDQKLQSYLKNNRQQTYSNVTWSDLRNEVNKSERANLMKFAINWQIDKIESHWYRTKYLCDCEEVFDRAQSIDDCAKIFYHILSWPIGIIFVYLAIPIYVCSRVFNFTFVWIALFNNDFNDIDHLQLGMAVLLGILQITWLISLIMVGRFHFVTWHILSGSKRIYLSCPNEEKAFVLLKRITDLHDAHTTEPERRKVILEHFGPDIASVVLDYMPTLIYDIGERMI